VKNDKQKKQWVIYHLHEAVQLYTLNPPSQGKEIDHG
jgi:hypothetical protein